LTVCVGHLWEITLIIGLCVSFNNMLDWKGILEKTGEINSAQACIRDYEAFR
jgi:hypothetical protein